ncbi:retropepsin-like aspartic protease [Angustibacter luteus]|uniref:Retropepsin-like aspartic protease n=1 Tax=Angustibacter luteus TaxID=658456 RepID=A0ABW1JAY5_9ACTN
MTSTTAFDRVGHMVRVPVALAGEKHRFLVDSGIGVTVVSPQIAARSDVRLTGETFTGRRMSGQELTLPIVQLPELRLGDYSIHGHRAVVADLGPVDGPTGFAGILSPRFFAGNAVTTDPDAMSLTVRPVAGLDEQGYVIPLQMRAEGPALTPFAVLILPSGREIEVEVDTGSQNTILDVQYLDECGVDLAHASVTTTTGVDETGHEWTRHWSTIAGQVHLKGAPETAQPEPRVQFQEIIHDGLIGTDYLERYRVTLDAVGARLILSPRTTTAP